MCKHTYICMCCTNRTKYRIHSRILINVCLGASCTTYVCTCVSYTYVCIMVGTYVLMHTHIYRHVHILYCNSGQIYTIRTSTPSHICIIHIRTYVCVLCIHIRMYVCTYIVNNPRVLLSDHVHEMYTRSHLLCCSG